MRTSFSALAFVPAAMVLASCAQGSVELRSEDTTAILASAESAAAAPVGPELLELDTSRLPAGIRIEGDIVGGARWRDVDGESLLLVTWSSRLAEDDVERHDIRGYCWRIKSDLPPNLIWRVHDYAENPCDDGEGLVSRVEVADLDQDGRAENAFVYNVAGPCDVSPVTYKLMLHSGPGKFAVRGDTRVDLGDGARSGGEKQFDETFDSAPREFRAYSSGLWDRTVGQYDVRVANRE